MRFIHIADVHLGVVPDRGYPWSERRQEEIWESFRRLIMGIREDPVDILLIAGDLFHRQPLLRELNEVRYLFSQIPDTRVYLMAGNHDYLSETSFYRQVDWTENVIFFDSERVQRIRDPKKAVYVYGMSYERAEIREPLYQAVQPYAEEGDEQALHILLAHGGDPNHIPIRVRALLHAGFDYIALGHIHKPEILVENMAAYAGALEPIDRGDEGMHGYIEGTLHNGRLKIRFIPFACRQYRTIVENVGMEDTGYSLEDKVKAKILSQGAGNIYQVVMKGYRSPEQVFLPERIRRLGNILEVTDETRPAFDLEELSRVFQGTIIGDYLAQFRLAGDLSEVEEKALYYGLQALMETARLEEAL